MADNPIGDLMSKFTGMKQKIDEAAQNAAKRTATATVGGGMVSATANGKQEITRVTIDPQALADKSMLEDLIAAAVNQAIAQTKGFVQDEIQKAVGALGIPLPPGFDLSKFF
jgi:DNA-binding YbaB/EbfC family protein